LATTARAIGPIGYAPGMALERTLVIIKPDGVQRALVGPILTRLEARGLKLVGLKLVQVSRALAEQHYAEHLGKGFYAGLLQYITSAPVVVACVEGTSAVQMVRNTVGVTNPLNAAPGTIRGDLALDIGRNLIHASDAPETAARELALWFTPTELTSYERATDRWIFE
jgi:nucleoside-diphosphate kinase